MNKSMWNSEAVKAYESGQGVVLVEKPYPHYEPVGRFAKFTDGIWREVTDGSAGVPLYTTPQRTWVGLTDEDRLEFAKAQHGWEDLLIAAEAKLKQKNT